VGVDGQIVDPFIGYVPYITGQTNYYNVKQHDLAYHTTWYWQVIPTNSSKGDAVGAPVWSFTTALNPLPNMAMNPTPANAATNVLFNASGKIVLAWKYIQGAAFSKPTSFKIRVGTSTNADGSIANPVVTTVTYVENQIDYTNEQALVHGTTYYWKVLPSNANGDAADAEVWSFTTEPQVAIDSNSNLIPLDYVIEQNFPNPFNPETSITFGLPKESKVRIDIYNVLGQLTATLINETQSAGYHTIKWNGRDQFDNPMKSGIYLYRISTDGYTQTRRMILMK